ncbi:UNVERIFIED_CONTAM: putative transcriptional regulator [Brevibacillus sp. OAP136]
MIKLRELRVSRGRSQEEVARAANISVKQYYNIEKGISTPTVKVAIRICDFLEGSIYSISEWNE